MGARREQRSKREPQTDSAYQPSLHLLLLPSLSEHFFPHGLQPLLSSHLSYRRIKCGHFKVLPHTRVPGACVFSLFKMEWPNPSLAVCDGNGNYEEYLCICVFTWRHRHVSVIIRALDDCVTLLKMSLKHARLHRAGDALILPTTHPNNRDRDKCWFS